MIRTIYDSDHDWCEGLNSASASESISCKKMKVLAFMEIFLSLGTQEIRCPKCPFLSVLNHQFICYT